MIKSKIDEYDSLIEEIEKVTKEIQELKKENEMLERELLKKKLLFERMQLLKLKTV